MTALPISERDLKQLAELCQDCQAPAIGLPGSLSAKPRTELERVYHRLVSEAADYLRILNDHEIAEIARSMGPWLTRTIEAPLLSREREIRDVALFYVSWCVNRARTNFRALLKAMPDQSRVLQAYPEISEFLDEDGLLRINNCFRINEWGILYKDHVLHYHQLLRRGYSGRPNMDFTGPFSRFAITAADRSKFRIAFDHARLVPREELQRGLEFDTWYGPPFDKTRLDDPGCVGLTVVARNKGSLFNQGDRLDFTDFFWSYKDGIKTFELEEASSPDHQFSGLILNRYVHSERETAQRRFRHLDGAVKIFEPSTYSERMNRHLPDTKFATKKIKLWRIDGDIPDDDWIDLIAMFLKGNEMVMEYFDPEGFKERFPLRVRDYEAWKLLSEEEKHRHSDGDDALRR
jgi:hypothetical protein